MSKINDKNTIKPAIEKYASKLTEKTVEKENEEGRKSSKEKRDEASQEKDKGQDKTEVKNRDKPAKIKPAPMDKPKMPASSYLRFSQAMMDVVRKEQPNLTQTDLMAVTGHMWNELPKEDKEVYEQAYRRDKQKYDAKMAEYYRKYPEQKTKKQLRQESRDKK